MEDKVWNILNHLLMQSVNPSVGAELGKMRQHFPPNIKLIQNVVQRFESHLYTIDHKHRQKFTARMLTDIAVWIEKTWHYSGNSLRVCCGDSNESLATVCRVALQEAWYADTGSSPFSATAQGLRPVIYLSPATPSHTRRWLSLNLCCPGLLITNLPADASNDLPSINVNNFTNIVNADLRLGRQPLLLVAYAGSSHFGSSDELQSLATACKQFKIWLHVEGLSFLQLALTNELNEAQLVLTTVTSTNLELSRIIGLSHSINVVLLHSVLPESILLYLNVFPLPNEKQKEIDYLEEETRSREVTAIPPSFAASCLSNSLFAWTFLRLHLEGLSDDPVTRLRHANSLNSYTKNLLTRLPSIEVLHSLTDDSPVILFRYQNSPESNQNSSEVIHECHSVTFFKQQSLIESEVRKRCKSEGNMVRRQITDNERFVNGLNGWLVSALRFELSHFGIKSQIINGNQTFLRFSALDIVNLMSIENSNIDVLIRNISTNSLIMEATSKQRHGFRKMISTTPGLYQYHFPDWAGIGAAFYVPSTYRCLFPEQGPLDTSDEELTAFQHRLVSRLLRLPPNAAKDIVDMNRDIVTRLRNHDFAFSSARINIPKPGVGNDDVSIAQSRSPSIAEVLEPLTSHTVSSSPGLGSRSGNSLSASNTSAAAKSLTVQMPCLRFGLITPGTDTHEMLQLVLQVANEVEEDSKYVNSLSEVVKRGIEEATIHLKEAQMQKIREEGVLRQVPFLDKLVNWFYPPCHIQIHGRMLNLPIGELMSTESLLPPVSESASEPRSPSIQATIDDENDEEAEEEIVTEKVTMNGVKGAALPISAD